MQHFETTSDIHLRACYIAQSVMGLGRVNRLHCWCMHTSASDYAVCESVTPLPYPDVTWFSAVLGVGPELLLFVESGTKPTWSSCFSFVIFGGVLCSAIILAVVHCTQSTIYVPQPHVHRRTRSRFLFMMPRITSPLIILDQSATPAGGGKG